MYRLLYDWVEVHFRDLIVESVTSILIITFNGDLVVSMEITVEWIPSCSTSPTLQSYSHMRTYRMYTAYFVICVVYLYCIHNRLVLYNRPIVVYDKYCTVKTTYKNETLHFYLNYCRCISFILLSVTPLYLIVPCGFHHSIIFPFLV